MQFCARRTCGQRRWVTQAARVHIPQGDWRASCAVPVYAVTRYRPTGKFPPAAAVGNARGQCSAHCPGHACSVFVHDTFIFYCSGLYAQVCPGLVVQDCPGYRVPIGHLSVRSLFLFVSLLCIYTWSFLFLCARHELVRAHTPHPHPIQYYTTLIIIISLINNTIATFLNTPHYHNNYYNYVPD